MKTLRLLWLSVHLSWVTFHQRHLCLHRLIALQNIEHGWLFCCVCGMRWKRRARGANDWAKTWEADS